LALKTLRENQALIISNMQEYLARRSPAGM
jgi:hypothetical protein